MALNPKQIKIDEDASCSTFEKETTIADFNPCTSDFAEIVKTNCLVDKTPLIRTIFCSHATKILITAPRRFGKSTNMDMLKKFVEKQVDKNGAVIDESASSNYQIFKDNKLSIFQDKKFFNQHFATYPVIHANFKCVGGNSFEEVLGSLRRVLRYSYWQHEYLLTSKIWLQRGFNVNTFEKYFDTEKSKTLDIDEIQEGLEFLSVCLYRHFGHKVFVLIDEYDAPITDTMFKNTIDINDVKELLCKIFSNTLKENEYVERALLTGISYFATVGLSGVNNIEKFMFLGDHQFVPYYGLTMDEVTKLLTMFKIDGDTKEKVKLHYNGYVSLKDEKLFSIWSILHFLQKKKIVNFWQESGVITKLKDALNIPVVRYSIEKLCLEKSLVIEISSQVDMDDIIDLQKICSQRVDSEAKQLEKPDLYLSFILQQGYLTYEKTVNDDLYKVKATNAEIIQLFKKKLQQYYTPSVSSYLEKCALIFDKLSPSSGDEIFKEVITAFNTLLSKVKCKLIKKIEDTYHCLLFNVLCKTNFFFATEFAFNGGRIDLIVHKESFGIIIETKYLKSSSIALKQIIERYLSVFNDNRFGNISEKMYVGLNITKDNTAEIKVLVNSEDVSKAKSF